MQENNLTIILIWIIGAIVSLTVGSNMINKTLLIEAIPSIITVSLGWIVLLGTIISIILAVFNS